MIVKQISILVLSLTLAITSTITNCDSLYLSDSIKGHLPDADKTKSSSHHLMDPNKFNHIIKFARFSYSIDEQGNVSKECKSKYPSWNISSISGRTGIKGANMIKEIVDLTESGSRLLSVLNIKDANLDDAEQSGLFAFKENPNDTNKKTIIFSFNGTKSSSDILSDMNILKVDLPYGLKGKAHLGFVDAAKSSYSNVKEKMISALSDEKNHIKTIGDITNSKLQVELIFIGHSFGAAKALLTASFLFKQMGLTSQDHKNIKLSVITLGGPRVFNITAAKEIDDMFGCCIIPFSAYPLDPVTAMPPSISGYKHVGRTVNIPISSQAMNLASESYLYKAFYGDPESFMKIKDSMPYDLLKDKALSYLTTKGISSAIDYTVHLSHGCDTYISLILKDDLYRMHYNNEIPTLYSEIMARLLMTKESAKKFVDTIGVLSAQAISESIFCKTRYMIFFWLTWSAEKIKSSFDFITNGYESANN